MLVLHLFVLFFIHNIVSVIPVCIVLYTQYSLLVLHLFVLFFIHNIVTVSVTPVCIVLYTQYSQCYTCLYCSLYTI